MIFVFNQWKNFCESLQKHGFVSIPACEVTTEKRLYIVLKHDVETDVKKAYLMAKIEHQYGHRGSYYVQAYLLYYDSNIQLLREMQQMGHEISYHYDVMDSCHGDLDAAIEEFENNKKLFERYGFPIRTVCQHGNPVVERVGYTSNRDFFRSERGREMYPEIRDIMVNFKADVPTEYQYFSDAGRKFKLIYDPINNDRIPSDDKNVAYEDLMALFSALSDKSGNIISTHPHRWAESEIAYHVKATTFNIVKGVAKQVAKIPVVKKFMSRYYYLAKKI